MDTYPLRYTYPKAKGRFSINGKKLHITIGSTEHILEKTEIQECFCYRHVFFIRFLKSSKSHHLAGHSSKENIAILKAFYKPSSKQSPCPHCNRALLQQTSVIYCPSCYRMFASSKSLNDYEGHFYNFTSRGYFELCIPEDEDRHLKNISSFSLQFLAAPQYLSPFFDKLSSHGLYLVLSSLGLYFSWAFPPFFTPFFFCLVFFFFFFFAYYLTELMVLKAFVKLRSSDPMACLCRQIAQEGSELLDEPSFQPYLEHPGCLVNLFLHLKDKDPKAFSFLEKAYNLCPHHPFIQALYKSESPQKVCR